MRVPPLTVISGTLTVGVVAEDVAGADDRHADGEVARGGQSGELFVGTRRIECNLWLGRSFGFAGARHARR